MGYENTTCRQHYDYDVLPPGGCSVADTAHFFVFVMLFCLAGQYVWIQKERAPCWPSSPAASLLPMSPSPLQEDVCFFRQYRQQ